MVHVYYQFTDVQTASDDSTMTNTNVDDGSCAPFLYGCTDPAATTICTPITG